MIQSMTAFARSENKGEWGTAVCEIRSINHRYLELGLHLPDFLRVLDMPLRELMREHLNRGKIECYIRYQTPLCSQLFSINETLVKNLVASSETISKYLKNSAPISPFAILQWPGVLETQEMSLELLQIEILTLVKNTLLELVAARVREGESLKGLFLARLAQMGEELVKIRKRLPAVKIEQNNRLNKRFAGANIVLNSERVEQEVLFFLQKIDIAEELDRIDMHIQEIKRILQQAGCIGRRFDFLLQELNREANTLGSKSIDAEISHAAVELKVLIEQIREQVQNIE